MENKEKMKIARDYISRHKENVRVNWTCDLIDTFADMQGGVYGEVHEEGDGEFWIEIGKLDSDSGNSVIFEWTNNAA